jgi:hypothetical protein
MCKDCGGVAICSHGRMRVACKQCAAEGVGGSHICEHMKTRAECIECDGTRICPHKKRRSLCVACGGVSMCKHNRRRAECKECGGSQICIPHGRQKHACRLCKAAKAILNDELAALEMMESTNPSDEPSDEDLEGNKDDV